MLRLFILHLLIKDDSLLVAPNVKLWKVSHPGMDSKGQANW